MGGEREGRKRENSFVFVLGLKFSRYFYGLDKKKAREKGGGFFSGFNKDKGQSPCLKTGLLYCKSLLLDITRNFFFPPLALHRLPPLTVHISRSSKYALHSRLSPPLPHPTPPHPLCKESVCYNASHHLFSGVCAHPPHPGVFLGQRQKAGPIFQTFFSLSGCCQFP